MQYYSKPIFDLLDSLSENKDWRDYISSIKLSKKDRSFLSGLLFEYLRTNNVLVKPSEDLKESVLNPCKEYIHIKRRLPIKIHIIYELLCVSKNKTISLEMFWSGVDYRPKLWYSSQEKWKKRNGKTSVSFLVSSDVANDFKKCCKKNNQKYGTVIDSLLRNYILENS